MGSYAVLAVVLLAVGGYLLFRRTKRSFWVRMLLPLGYFLYVRTPLGYRMHLWQLRKKRTSPHSITQPLPLPGVTIVPVAIMSDNYGYVVIDTLTNTAVAIDPSDPEAIKMCLQENNVTLKAILTTHKHWDHAGGNDVLKGEFQGLAVYCGTRDHISGATHLLQDRDTVKIGKLTFEAIWTPGHTAGHVVFMLQSEPPCLFTGDHIFVGGSGHMFEANAETMLKSIKKITELQGNCLIFPGHEYAWMNLKFASTLLPSDVAVQNKLQWVRQQRARRLATVPSILSEELKYNPFLRTNSNLVKDALGLPHHSTEANVLAAVRKHKDEHRWQGFDNQ